MDAFKKKGKPAEPLKVVPKFKRFEKVIFGPHHIVGYVVGWDIVLRRSWEGKEISDIRYTVEYRVTSGEVFTYFPFEGDIVRA